MKKIDFKKAIQEKTQSIPLSLLETEERIKSELIVLDELRDFIHPLTTDEFFGLERTLLEEGITDPLIIWETSPEVAGIVTDKPLVYILMDGHHRYKVSRKHQLPFKIVLKKYATLDEVKTAMLDKQLNRRNLTPEQVSYYRGLKYNRMKEGQVGIEKHLNVASTLSKEFGVNEKTVRRDAAYAKGLDKLAPEFKQEVLAGQTQLPKSAIGVLAKIENLQPISTITELEELVFDEAKKPAVSQRSGVAIEELKNQVRVLASKDFTKSECVQLIKTLETLLPHLI